MYGVISFLTCVYTYIYISTIRTQQQSAFLLQLPPNYQHRHHITTITITIVYYYYSYYNNTWFSCKNLHKRNSAVAVYSKSFTRVQFIALQRVYIGCVIQRYTYDIKIIFINYTHTVLPLSTAGRSWYVTNSTLHNDLHIETVYRNKSL